MHNATSTSWDLPFSHPAEFELRTDFGTIELQAVEPGGSPRVELRRGSEENIGVAVEKHNGVVRISLEARGSFGWLSSWDCHIVLFVPPDVRGHIQTNAGSISARDLDGCELGIKAMAGTIELKNVHGFLHLAADAGSITGSDVGGVLNVEARAGEVKLEVTDLRAGDHRVKATMGSIRLDMARGLDVAIEPRTNLGSVENKYPSNPRAATKLLVVADLGEVEVREAGFERRVASSGPRPTTATSATAAASGGPTAAAAPAGAATPGAASTAQAPAPADPELERILKMVEAGEITASEADELLQAMGRL